MEAVCFIVRRNIEVIEGMGVPVSEIRALGGGARSRIWKQIEADITGRPVLTTRNEEAATLGAAILAGKAVGLYSSVAGGRGADGPDQGALRADRANMPVYDEAFRTYVDLYTALCPLFSQGKKRLEAMMDKVDTFTVRRSYAPDDRTLTDATVTAISDAIRDNSFPPAASCRPSWN